VIDKEEAMDTNILVLIFAFGGGLFCILSSILDWNWFFNSRKAQRIVGLMGRNGARIFYIVLGLLLIFIGFKSYNLL
jgi:hypothetical protein